MGALLGFLKQGYLSIDNNLSERTLRAIALGRNNAGVLGSKSGGRAALHSLVGTCKPLGIDPFAHWRKAPPVMFAPGETATAEQRLAWPADRWLLPRSLPTSVAVAEAS